jgi:hypothetical protein
MEMKEQEQEKPMSYLDGDARGEKWAKWDFAGGRGGREREKRRVTKRPIELQKGPN